MGEVFFKRYFLVCLVIISLISFSAICFAAHSLYSSFSSAGSGFGFDNVSNLVSVGDTAIYNVGYFSVNGSAWQNFSLSGAFYPSSNFWLGSSATATLPGFGVGEHYIIVYSCTYNSSNSSWDCHENKWQLIIVNITANNTNTNNTNNGSINNTPSGNSSCGNSTCKSNEYCFENVCLLNVSRHTYFVSTTGNDNNPGNYSQPWGTWQKAFNTADAGDIVYFREGVWYPTVSVIYDGTGAGNSGTQSKHIIYENYPGEIPILDLGNYPYTSDMSGLAINDVTYVEFRGLSIRNTPQNVMNQWIDGLQFYNCGTLWVDKIKSYGHGGYGIWFVGYDKLYLTNTDSYDNVDYLADDPGNRADGFQISSGSEPGDYTLVSGCRSWNNSDDGFEVSTQQEVHFYNNWAFGNGRLANGNGIGVKIGPSLLSEPSKRIFSNNIIASNKGFGFSHNFVNGPIVDVNYNNFVYNCEMGYNDDPGDYDCTLGTANTIHRNNMVYNVTLYQAYFESCTYQPENGPVYDTSDHDTWIDIMESPYCRTNPAYIVTNADFVSLDVSQLANPRKSDGSLPDITFAHLKAGSDLIDAGAIISGYHCATAGEHPGEDCAVWYGNAPDLGPFEYY